MGNWDVACHTVGDIHGSSIFVVRRDGSKGVKHLLPENSRPKEKKGSLKKPSEVYRMRSPLRRCNLNSEPCPARTKNAICVGYRVE